MHGVVLSSHIVSIPMYDVVLSPCVVFRVYFQLYQSLFAFQENMLILSYQGHKPKNVILMTSMHDDTATANDEKKKPHAIKFCNSTKGGVDTMDKLCLTYTTKHKTKRWPLVMFHNILDVSTVVARVVYQIKFQGDKLSKPDSRGDFVREVAKGLMKNQMIRRNEQLVRASRPLRNVMHLCLASMVIKAAPKQAPPHLGKREVYAAFVTGRKMPRAQCAFIAVLVMCARVMHISTVKTVPRNELTSPSSSLCSISFFLSVQGLKNLFEKTKSLYFPN